eukprot:9085347-Lingulodinium_polyedra.AAC.1
MTKYAGELLKKVVGEKGITYIWDLAQNAADVDRVFGRGVEGVRVHAERGQAGVHSDIGGH